ncbi:hypothetical protein GCM10009846_26030 [Agrococcus versicolor]|uniref:Gram-positive cocci surface proteins LPxTG domain-containing protein n=1 Tax=Agrococcus versicolor TaxID=501482 RepID=A0ABN3AXC1_9MICO
MASFGPSLPDAVVAPTGMTPSSSTIGTRGRSLRVGARRALAGLAAVAIAVPLTMLGATTAMAATPTPATGAELREALLDCTLPTVTLAADVLDAEALVAPCGQTLQLGGFRLEATQVTSSAAFTIAGPGTLVVDARGTTQSAILSTAGTLTTAGAISITAWGGDGGAGIGATGTGVFDLSSAIIRSTGGDGAPGIGRTGATSTGTIVIRSGTITATGGDGAAGIGLPRDVPTSIQPIQILGGQIEAIGGAQAAGIGGGRGSSYANIIFGGNARVTARGGTDGAGIGGGVGGVRVGVNTLSGGAPIITAYGNGAGAGIGTGGPGASTGGLGSPSVTLQGFGTPLWTATGGLGGGAGVGAGAGMSVPTTIILNAGVLNATSSSGPAITADPGGTTFGGIRTVAGSTLSALALDGGPAIVTVGARPGYVTIGGALRLQGSYDVGAGTLTISSAGSIQRLGTADASIVASGPGTVANAGRILLDPSRVTAPVTGNDFDVTFQYGTGATEPRRVLGSTLASVGQTLPPTARGVWSVAGPTGTWTTFTASTTITADVTVVERQTYVVTPAPEPLRMQAGQTVDIPTLIRDRFDQPVGVATSDRASDVLSGMRLTATSAGTRTITVRDAASGLVATVAVEVLPAATSSLVVSIAPSSIAAGESALVSVTGVDAFGNPAPVSGVTLASDERSDEISDLEVLATRAGDRTITATSGDGATGTATLRVVAGEAVRIELSAPTAAATAGVGSTFGVAAFDEFDNAADASAATLASSIATDEVAGLVVTGFAAGTRVVTATLGDLADAESLDVVAATAAELRLALSSSTVTADESIAVRITGVDAFDNPADVTGAELTSSRIDDTITGDATDGFTVSSTLAGQALLTARLGEASASASLEVRAASAAALTLTLGTGTAGAGEAVPYTVAATDEFGNATDATGAVVTSSIASDAVTSTTVTATVAGERVVTAALGDLRAAQPLAVSASVAASVVLTTPIDAAVAGETTTLTATATDEFGNAASLEGAALTSSEATDEVTGWDVVATLAGTRTVTVALGEDGPTATVQLVVVAAAPVTLTLTPTGASAIAGTTTAYGVTGVDAFGNPASTAGVTLSSTVASDDVAGLGVTATTAGARTIAATLDDVSTSTTLTVEAAALAVIDLAGPSEPVIAGSTATFAATGADAFGNPVPVSATLASSEATDVVDGLSIDMTVAGERTVAATVGDLRDSLDVRVVAGALATLTITPSATEVPQGGSVAVEVAGEDRYGNAIAVSAEGALASSDPTDVIVGSSVTFVTAGPRTLSATVGDVIATVVVQVASTPIVTPPVVDPPVVAPPVATPPVVAPPVAAAPIAAPPVVAPAPTGSRLPTTGSDATLALVALALLLMAAGTIARARRRA